MHAGVGSAGPVSQNGDIDRPVEICRDVRIVLLIEGLRSHGAFIMDLPGAFVDGHIGVRVGNREVPGGAIFGANSNMTISDFGGKIVQPYISPKMQSMPARDVGYRRPRPSSLAM